MIDENNENKLIEGEDFYFTWKVINARKHHLKKRHCCKSGCRHCPYGYDKNGGTNKKSRTINRFL
jgi:hypothetical protein